MNDQPHYSMIIQWSGEDEAYVVHLPEWGRFARTHGHTYEDAVRNGQEVLQLLIATAQDQGLPLPSPHVYENSPSGVA